MKYSIDEFKLRDLIASKVQNYFQKAAEAYESLNPNFILSKDLQLTEEESNTLEKIQSGELPVVDAPKDLEAKINAINARLEEIADKEKSGELNMELFTVEELKSFFEFSNEDILNIVYDGKKESV